MEIYLLRHAIAGERDSKKYPDDRLRPLTSSGKRKMERAACGMRAAHFRFDVILTSPLTRAKETAEIVRKTLRYKTPLRTTESLASGATTAAVLKEIPVNSKRALLVGHEPDLSMLAAELLMHTRMPFPLEFRKGGICRIDMDGVPKPGLGQLVYHLTPKLLRQLAESR